MVRQDVARNFTITQRPPLWVVEVDNVRSPSARPEGRRACRGHAVHVSDCPQAEMLALHGNTLTASRGDGRVAGVVTVGCFACGGEGTVHTAKGRRQEPRVRCSESSRQLGHHRQPKGQKGVLRR